MTKIFYTISFIFFIDSFSVGLVLPFMPELFLNAQFGLLAHSSNQTIWYSVSLALFSLTAFTGMPFLGAASDRYGRKKLLNIGLVGISLNYSLGYIAILNHNIWLFLLSRAIDGFLIGGINVGFAIIGNLNSNTQGQKSSTFSRFKFPVIADKLGLMLGACLAYLIHDTSSLQNNLAIPYFIAAIIVLIGFLLFQLNSTDLKNQTICHIKKQYQWKSLFEDSFTFFQNKPLRWLGASLFFYQLGSGLFIQGVTLFLALVLGYTPGQIGIFSFYMNAMLIISLLSTSDEAKQNKFYLFILKVGLLTHSAIFLTGFLCIQFNEFFLSSAVIRVWLAVGLFCLSMPLMRLIFRTLFFEGVKNSRQGLSLGAYGQITALSFFISALLVGHLVLYHLVLLCSSVFFLMSLLFISIYFRILKKASKHD